MEVIIHVVDRMGYVHFALDFGERPVPMIDGQDSRNQPKKLAYTTLAKPTRSCDDLQEISLTLDTTQWLERHSGQLEFV